MRTTLSLDDDIAFLLKKESHRTGSSFKEVVNRFLRLGLMAERRPMHKPFTVSPRNLGLPRNLSYDSVEQLLEAVEWQVYR